MTQRRVTRIRPKYSKRYDIVARWILCIRRCPVQTQFDFSASEHKTFAPLCPMTSICTKHAVQNVSTRFGLLCLLQTTLRSSVATLVNNYSVHIKASRVRPHLLRTLRRLYWTRHPKAILQLTYAWRKLLFYWVSGRWFLEDQRQIVTQERSGITISCLIEYPHATVYLLFFWGGGS